MFESWRAWVREQGVGPDDPPTPWLRQAIERRLMPVIRNPSIPVSDRVQAIRDWQQAGYPVGANALIDILREPGALPKEEIIWSLRPASGMAWGDESDRWRAWYDGLPDDCREASELTGGGLGA